MAKNAVTDWSTTAANNTDIGGIGIQGTNVISNFDNAKREMMAQIATFITGAAFTGTVTITSADAGAGAAPILDAYRNSASPAAADELGQISFNGNDSGGNKTLYGYIAGQIADATNGSEDGTINFGNVVAGTPTIQATITATGWNGMNIGATTRGTGAFTTLAASGAFSLTGDQVQVPEGGTGVATFTAGIVVGNGTSALISRTLTAPAAGITVTNGTGVAGNPTLALANDLAALEALASTGIAVRTTTDTWAQRTLTGTSAEITVTNGDGVSGNPTLSLPTAMTMTGKTLTGGTYAGAALNGTLGATTPAQVQATDIFSTTGLFAKNNSTSSAAFAGGASSVNGATWIMYGSSHATTPNDALMTVGAGSTRYYFNGTTNLHTWYSGAGSVAATLGTSGMAVNNGINSTAIGATTPSTGAFTTLTSNSLTVANTGDIGYAASGSGNINGGAFSTSGVSAGVQITASEWRSSINTTIASFHARFYNPNGAVGSISTSASATSFTTSSDYRLKEKVSDFWDSAEIIDRLRPVSYLWKNGKTQGVGFLAHEAQEAFPDAVVGEKDAVDEDGNPLYQGGDWSKLVPVLVAELKSLRARVAELELR